MARLSKAESQKREEKIKNALILGESQYQAAKNFDVSTATVNKIYKTIKEDEFLVKEVKAEIAIKSKLNAQSESLVKAFSDKVNDELRRQNLVYGAQEKAIKKASYMIDAVDTAQDIKHLVDAIDKASITLGVSQRHSNQNINVNSQTNVGVQSITRKIVD